MFATVPNISPERSDEIPFFGLPGNPVAITIAGNSSDGTDELS
ncbi:hypothetical protein CGLO_17774 [Colletotrichum gloeosporioides Cg-14]|uniref:Uncharacterized protein n=1 Tax=Colletotrichum gloeosporioides (strain Cg-14) TaxID=1237896 RepID=T0JSY0_COLGC|nr:hypothetical protein CGLO_17774 [Colletotrichum gloeosporioides Cg-14]